MKRALLVAAALALGGCPKNDKPPPPTCMDTFIGDPSLPVEAILVVTDGVSNTLVDVKDGDTVPLVRPPQGGQVTYAAARVRNINRCAVQFRGRFQDPATGNELGFDGRNADLIVGDDGWGRPDVTHLSNLANVPLCPDYDATRDYEGQPAILQMTIEDQHGHSTVLHPTVVPTCAASDPAMQALCVCECNHLPAGTTRSCAVTDGGP